MEEFIEQMTAQGHKVEVLNGRIYVDGTPVMEEDESFPSDCANGKCNV